MQELNTTLTDGILHIELNAPAKKNALTDTLRTELRETVAAAQDDRQIQCMVLSGAGGNFCSGGDISAMTSDRDLARRRMTILHDVVRLLIGGQKPVIAAVSGPAFGAGLSLALCCDQIICDDTARFCASFGRVGLPPDLALSWTLPRRIGEAPARRMLLSTRIVDAPEAVQLRLTDELTRPEDLLGRAFELAREFAAFTQESKGHVKSLVASAAGSLDAILEREMESYITLLNSEEYRAARERFLAKSRT
ncbi:enoyl-CoA hydratase/isomerase family protein [Thalassospira profundimaris]|nr:enoyl-CoA hydratase-related protein [Thalassospira profundimaris]